MVASRKKRAGSVWLRAARRNVTRLPGRTARIGRGIASGTYGWSDAKKDMVGPYKEFTHLPKLRQGALPPPSKRPRIAGGASTSMASGNVTSSSSGTQRAWVSRKFRLGQAMSSNALALKSMKANLHSSVFRWSRFNVINDEVSTGGALWMYNKTISPDTARSLPLYAWDLTSCNNFQGPSTFIQAVPCTRMQISTSGGVDFVDVTAVTNDGVTATPNWTLEKSAGNEQTVYPRERDYLKWINIKLNLYGTKYNTTKYTIMLCQFKMRELCPDNSTNLEGGADTVVRNEKRDNYYQSLMKPLTVNPIATTNNFYSKYVKVLRKQTVVLQDQSSDSLDTDPLSQVVSWFVRTNKVCNYKSLATNLPTLANAVDEADFSLNTGGQNSTRIHTRARLYLIVYCNNYGQDTAANPTTDYTPSFDANIRVCHQGFD